MIFIFNDCEINVRLYTLLRNGETIRLRPKVFQVLEYLLTHRDRVISKQELAERLWPDEHIADSTLESTIRDIRRAVGDSGRQQEIIQTLPGHGYRFIAIVTEIDEEAESTSAAPDELAQDTWSCPSCGHPNSMTAKFCSQCGTAFAPSCPRCHAASSPSAKFCTACGLELSTAWSDSALAPVESSQPTSAKPLRPEPERRQLTVLSCDLADAIQLSEQLPTTDVRHVLRAYRDQCNDLIQHFGGYVAQYVGTRLLAYFGYPPAHEDDAQRAVHAGLDILGVASDLNRMFNVRLAMRLGIHTGFVITGDLSEGEQDGTLLLGDTPNIATQIQAMAEPDTVVISDATARLTEGYFIQQPIDNQRLSGAANAVQLYRVLGVSDARSRFDAVDAEHLTQFVDREVEMALLQQRWAQAETGSGQAVLLSGEPGIGKSRIVRALRACQKSLIDRIGLRYDYRHGN